MYKNLDFLRVLNADETLHIPAELGIGSNENGLDGKLDKNWELNQKAKLGQDGKWTRMGNWTRTGNWTRMGNWIRMRTGAVWGTGSE